MNHCKSLFSSKATKTQQKRPLVHMCQMLIHLKIFIIDDQVHEGLLCPVYCQSGAENHVNTSTHTYLCGCARAHTHTRMCYNIYVYYIVCIYIYPHTYFKYKDIYLIFIYTHTHEELSNSPPWPRGSGLL